MRFIADLHIHSRFSRATSRDLSLPELYVWAQKKGIFVVGTGDITHPAWLDEISEQLVPAEEGLFRLLPELAREADERVPAACRSEVRFLLQGEISSIYKHEDAVRKVHNLVYCPDLETARRLMTTLDRMGNVRSDGRPILGMSSRDVLEVLLAAGEGTHLIPAHVWTPWFSILGSKSGYESIDACFGDLAGEIFALETGLSSDPSMNWRLSALDQYGLVSNSDAHSGKNLGREANEFDLEPCYGSLFESLRRGGDPGFLGTLEFFPEHGKYHLDGHRKCGQRLSPEETLEAGGRCPACGGKITVGVLHRVEELADRPEGFRPDTARPFTSLVPLAEVLAECFGVGSGTKRVRTVFEQLLSRLGPELFVLCEAPLEEVAAAAGPLVTEAVGRVRDGRLRIAAGYDGEFGTIRIFGAAERAELQRQGALFAAAAPLSEHAQEGTGEGGAGTTEPRIRRAAAGLVETTARGRPSLEQAQPSEAPQGQLGAPASLNTVDLRAGAPGGGAGAFAECGTGSPHAQRPRERTTSGSRSSPRLETSSEKPPVSHSAKAPTPPSQVEGAPSQVSKSTALPASLPLFPELEGDRALAGLNPEQRAAVLAPPDPLAILAGPGTGKTRTLTRRIAHKVLSGAMPPGRILAVTFTNRAAAEMRARLVELLGPKAEGLSVLTLHRLGLTLLRAEADAAGLRRDFAVLGAEEGLALLRDATALSAREAAATHAAISLTKRSGIPPDDEIPGWAAYEAALAEAGAVDLDELIARPVRLLETQEEVRRRWQARFGHVAVDEFQDFDALQYRFLSLLAPADVTVIGDPDQSIYGFRGADPELFDRFAAERPRAAQVALVQNYRSTATIIEASSQLIGADGKEAHSAVMPFLSAGPRLHLINTADERTEAEFVVREVERLVGGTSHRSLEAGRVSDGEGSGEYSFGDIAILGRLKAQQTALEDALARSGIPYRSVGDDRLLTRGKGRAVLVGLRRGAPDEPPADAIRRLLRELELAPEDPVVAGWLAAAAASATVGGLVERVVLRSPDDDFDPRAEAITLLTLHASKGLEFDVVFLTGCEEGVLPYFRDGREQPDAIAEERRLLYVGMTRARQRLYLTRAQTRRIYGETRRQQPCRFLNDIETALVTAMQAGQPGGGRKRRHGRQLSLW